MKTKDSFTQVLKFTLSNIFWVFRTFSYALLKPQKITVSFIAILFLSAWFCLPAFCLSTLDLTTSGSSGYIGDAYFMQVDPQPTGSGYIHSFVRVSTNQGIEQGYNTDARPLEFDENSSPEFTRALLVDDVPIYNLDGTAYRGFLLDINQTKSDSYLSLDGLEIFLADEGDRSGYPFNLGTNIYDLDTDGDNRIKLDYSLNHGSGTGDMMAYIPNDLFVGGSYVYLYSIFGQSEDSAFPNNDGYEEWATIPSPAALILGCIGISCIGWLRRWNFA